jgi:hypothetical protein
MNKPMTLDEKFVVLHEAHALRDSGDIEGYNRVMKTVPVPDYLAKVIKEKVGLDFLLQLGWNLSEAEEKFGAAWLCK